MSLDYQSAESRRRTVLVAVMNNAEDFRRAASDGWYRIPQRRAPRRIGADYLAFYQTGAFKGAPEAQTVTYFAPTRRYRLATRAELLPHEADHPRAAGYYFRIDLGPLQRLEKPVPSAKYHRITFIHTTLDRLLTAEDVRDLPYKEDPFEKLWHALREHRLRPLQESNRRRTAVRHYLARTRRLSGHLLQRRAQGARDRADAAAGPVGVDFDSNQ